MSLISWFSNQPWIPQKLDPSKISLYTVMFSTWKQEHIQSIFLAQYPGLKTCTWKCFHYYFYFVAVVWLWLLVPAAFRPPVRWPLPFLLPLVASMWSSSLPLEPIVSALNHCIHMSNYVFFHALKGFSICDVSSVLLKMHNVHVALSYSMGELYTCLHVHVHSYHPHPLPLLLQHPLYMKRRHRNIHCINGWGWGGGLCAYM